jgi:hypothetical protein
MDYAGQPRLDRRVLMSVVATFWPQIVGAVTFYDTTALIIHRSIWASIRRRAKGQANDDPPAGGLARQRRPCRARWA